MTHSRNEGRWSAVPAIGGSLAALLILSSCAREASSPVSPETAVVASSIQSAAAKKAAGFQLTVTLAGNGNGMVKSSPSGIACGGIVNKSGNGGNGGNCNGSFSEPVTLTATGIGGSTFTGWSGDACDGSMTPTCIVDAAKSVTATFSRGVVISYILTVTSTAGGAVTSSPSGITNCSTSCTASFVAGTEVTLTAAADLKYQFDGMSNCAVDAPNSCKVMMDGAKTVDASFSLLPVAGTDQTLNVTIVGVGSVTTVPSGVDCVVEDLGKTLVCPPASFTSGSSVVIFATGSVSSWSGCDSFDATTCTVTMGTVTVGADRAVTVTFLGGLTAVAVAHSGSDPSPLHGMGSAAITSAQTPTRSALIEQQR